MKKVGSRAKREYGPWMSTNSIEYLSKNNEGPRKALSCAMVRGGRSVVDGGSWLGGSRGQRR